MKPIQDESKQLFIIGSQQSRLPIFWEAHTRNGEYICQIDEYGEIAHKWSELPVGELTYWGLVSSVGRYGFLFPSRQVCVNTMPLSLVGVLPEECEKLQSDPWSGPLHYRRNHILDATTGARQTRFVEIGVSNTVLRLQIYPHKEVLICPRTEKQ